jgi:hypothetical protein
LPYPAPEPRDARLGGVRPTGIASGDSAAGERLRDARAPVSTLSFKSRDDRDEETCSRTNFGSTSRHP